MRLDLAPQLIAQGCIIPLVPANEALERQARLAKTLGNRFDVFAFDIRQQATDIDFGVLNGGLAMEDFDKGLHKGVKTWDDLLENLRGNLAFFQQLAFAKGVSRFHDKLLL
jgi:hypothetical protein